MITQLLKRLPGIRGFVAIKQSLLESTSLLRKLYVLQSQYILDRMIKSHPHYSDDLRLLKYSFQISSQSGEDGIIAEIFRRIGERDRVFVEIGVGDGTENNTIALLARGWSGLWIDGDLALQSGHMQMQGNMRKRLKAVNAYVTKENISEMLLGQGIKKDFDFLSLDIDQNTYHIWESLADFRPRAVVIEYNANIPPQFDWKVAYQPERTWDNTRNFGASLKAFELLGSKLGYNLVGCDFAGANAFFVRKECCESNAFRAPFTAENHHYPPQYFANFDSGHKKCIWDDAS